MVYEKIESLYIIKGTIETVGTLYIGLGEKDELRDVELPFIRLSDGRVFIPASSIKGALRSSVERICKSLGFAICSIDKKGGKPEYNICTEKKSCISCIIFGSTNMASRVLIKDALPLDRLEEGKGITIKPGIALHRETKTVIRGALFRTEVVDPGAKFSLEIIIVNPEKWMLGLIYAGLKAIETTGLGGQVTRGPGKVKFVIDEIVKHTAKSIIGEENPEVYKDKRAISFLEECLREFKEKYKELIKKYQPP